MRFWVNFINNLCQLWVFILAVHFYSNQSYSMKPQTSGGPFPTNKPNVFILTNISQSVIMARNINWELLKILRVSSEHWKIIKLSSTFDTIAIFSALFFSSRLIKSYLRGALNPSQNKDMFSWKQNKIICNLNFSLLLSGVLFSDIVIKAPFGNKCMNCKGSDHTCAYLNCSCWKCAISRNFELSFN